MEEKAKEIVKWYVYEHLDRSEDIETFGVYTVWKCKALQNWKFIISTTLPDGMYYEVTFNGVKREWYLDAYKKFENRCIPDSVTVQALKDSYERHNNRTLCSCLEDLVTASAEF